MTTDTGISTNKAQRLRDLADALTKKIEEKRNPGCARQNPTRRRQNIADAMAREADQMERLQVLLRALAEGHDDGTLSPLLVKIGDRATVETILDRLDWPAPSGCYFHAEEVKRKARTRLERAGIGRLSYADARAALLALESPELQQRQRAAHAAREQKNRVHNLIGLIPGFFPTPPAVADQLIDLARIESGMVVLEPSAGSGALAARVLHHHPDARVVCVEASPDLANYLTAQGFDLVGLDFLDDDFLHAEGVPDAFERIVMNPPFEQGQDITHVRRAASLLTPNGRLAAVMSPGPFFREDRQAVEFRAWLASCAYVEVIDVPAGAFQESKTDVATKLVVIEPS